MNKDDKGFSFIFHRKCRVVYNKFWAFPQGPGGFRKLRRLVGTISTYPGTCRCPWSRDIDKNPRGEPFYRVRYKEKYLKLMKAFTGFLLVLIGFYTSNIAGTSSEMMQRQSRGVVSKEMIWFLNVCFTSNC